MIIQANVAVSLKIYSRKTFTAHFQCHSVLALDTEVQYQKKEQSKDEE